jgi:hypothetical protein
MTRSVNKELRPGSGHAIRSLVERTSVPTTSRKRPTLPFPREIREIRENRVPFTPESQFY